jgi:hypothetical protein
MSMNARDKPSALALALALRPDVMPEDPVGGIARQLVLNLAVAIGDKSIRPVAQSTSVGHVT